MSQHGKETALPSYEDSINAGLPLSRGQHILDNLTLVRAKHIRAIVDNAIIPLIEDQALRGIAQTTIVMLPSDILNSSSVTEKSDFSFATEDDEHVEVQGLSSEEKPQIIRLAGPLNKTEFWKPPAIIKELERVLMENLMVGSGGPSSSQFQPKPIGSQGKQPKKGLLGRMTKAFQREESSVEQDSTLYVPHPDPNSGRVTIEARLEEMCLRTVNEFGLYDTTSKQCIIIRIDAGH
ncbi:hypothetical protein BU24DRAFT_426270 [Aaosphaeria arxii CBS 175.79]|uniref:Uncharacterized protein n=1 Tax=Aaosphaeria arxii CBS 175.79 TaxID=1450172 RepID=A0A6A5XHQ3_9PLEO|nr:uncharacterized protein BU24DRAFT_426270 [Aaosphaeria arxii CBS 175.79]KAF2012387.1 hypothetical protein BU24DRAFT_426270 [Aaosphaeria arxii CBS 175.79]